MQYDLISRLRPLADEGYRAFHLGLVPELDAAHMLGVRMPALRAFGKELAKSVDAQAILDDRTPDFWYEETVVRGVVTGAARMDFPTRLEYISAFVPYITNWALCDGFVSGLKCRTDDLPALRAFLEPYLASREEFPARFGAVMLLRFFIREDCLADTLERLAALPAEGYNARMAAAWALAECLVRFPEQTLPVLLGEAAPPWTRRKAVQKALESRRLPASLRPQLKQLRRTIPPMRL